MELQRAAPLDGAAALAAVLLSQRATVLAPFVSVATQTTLMLPGQVAVIEESSTKDRLLKRQLFRKVQLTRPPVRAAPPPPQQWQRRVTSPGARCKPCRSWLLLRVPAD